MRAEGSARPPAALPGLSLPALLAFLLVAACGVAVRGAWPVDETRYSAVAWAMWWRGDFLVPYLSGEPYSHKPPLLFWLVNAGWLVTGVGETWPRVLPWLLGLAQLLALNALARSACPARPVVAARAVWLQASLTLWLAWSGMLAFDVLLTVCLLMALRPMASALVNGQALRPLEPGFWLGCACLAKGPVALVVALPAMLLLPLARRSLPDPAPSAPGPTADLRSLLLVLCGAALVAAAWALPAALAGGKAYAGAILWGQMAGRVVDSFAHRQPLWWYLPWLPLLLFPWALRPDLFIARVPAAGTPEQALRRWLLGTLASAFVALSMVSGKQLHYLVPLLPLTVLWLALRFSDARPASAARTFWLLPALVPAVLALLLALVATGTLRHDRWPAWVAQVDALPAAGLLAVAVVGGYLSRSPALPASAGPAFIGIATLLVLQIGVIRLADHDFRMEAVASRLAAAEADGRGWAYVGGYAGEFDLAGRLRKPPFLPADLGSLEAWAREARGEAIIMRMFRGELPEELPRPVLVQDWRGKRLGLWRAVDVAASPSLAQFLAP
jgi:4-amino-4-deoxy-L-arabinose transferase-like glycosyltransferase